MGWRVERVIDFQKDERWRDGIAQFGFHVRSGNHYVLDHGNHWLGQLGAHDRLAWSAGPAALEETDLHITLDLRNPMHVTDGADGTVLASNLGNRRIYKIDPARGSANLFADGEALGFKDMGNCVSDHDGKIWVNEVEGCRIWQLDSGGRPIQTLGDGIPGFQQEDVPFEKARFSWVYDIRCGPEGNIYVLDSKNFSVRMIDLGRRVVSRVVGTGRGGYSGDGGNAHEATLGHSPHEHFDGPWSLSLDEEGNIYIGDTQNHVVRAVERETNTVSTIAGNPQAEPGRRNSLGETDPLNLNLPKICSMDYCRGRLFVPADEGDWDLIVLAKT